MILCIIYITRRQGWRLEGLNEKDLTSVSRTLGFILVSTSAICGEKLSLERKYHWLCRNISENPRPPLTGALMNDRNGLWGEISLWKQMQRWRQTDRVNVNRRENESPIICVNRTSKGLWEGTPELPGVDKQHVKPAGRIKRTISPQGRFLSRIHISVWSFIQKKTIRRWMLKR